MGILFAILVALFWALYNFVVRRARTLMDPGAGYLLTLLVNVAANLLITRLPLPGAGSTGLAWQPVLFFVLAGLSTTLMGRWFLFESIFILGPSRASAWKNVAPVYTLILGAIFLKEPVTLLSVCGVGVSLLGMWVLAREQGRGETGLPPAATVRAGKWMTVQRMGLIFATGSGVAFALGYLFRRAGLLAWPDAAWGNAIGAMAALVSWLPISLYKGEFGRLLRARGPGLNYWLLAGLVSTMAQLFTFLALRVLTTTTTQIITSLEPVFTMGLSLVFLGSRENLNPRLAVAVTAICVGVALVIL